MFDQPLTNRPFELTTEVLDFLTKRAGKTKRLDWSICDYGTEVSYSLRYFFDNTPIGKIADILAPYSIYLMANHRDGDGVNALDMLCDHFDWLAANCRYYWFYHNRSVKFASQRDAALFTMWRM